MIMSDVSLLAQGGVKVVLVEGMITERPRQLNKSTTLCVVGRD